MSLTAMQGRFQRQRSGVYGIDQQAQTAKVLSVEIHEQSRHFQQAGFIRLFGLPLRAGARSQDCVSDDPTHPSFAAPGETRGSDGSSWVSQREARRRSEQIRRSAAALGED